MKILPNVLHSNLFVCTQAKPFSTCVLTCTVINCSRIARQSRTTGVGLGTGRQRSVWGPFLTERGDVCVDNLGEGCRWSHNAAVSSPMSPPPPVPPMGYRPRGADLLSVLGAKHMSHWIHCGPPRPWKSLI